MSTKKEHSYGSMWPVNIDSLEHIVNLFSVSKDELLELIFPWELLVLLQNQMHKLILETSIGKNVEISDRSYIEGPVVIEDGVKILPFSVIIGPSFIGRGSLVGNHTQVRGSFVGHNSVIGAGTEIVRSVCLSETSFHRNYVGDSFLGSKVHIGGDSALANVRMDKGQIKSLVSNKVVNTKLSSLGAFIGNDTFIAGKAVVMPGIKIGSNCMVGPRVIVKRDLQDNFNIEIIQDSKISVNL